MSPHPPAPCSRNPPLIPSLVNSPNLTINPISVSPSPTAQAGDEESLRLWRSICEVSRREFASLYERLGVSLEERGESFYNQRIPAVLEELTAKQVRWRRRRCWR